MKVVTISFILLLSCFGIVQAKTVDLQTKLLVAHNHWRTLHNAPNLVWDEALANYALNYAKKCRFQHSSSGYGENLAEGYKSITAAVDAWYAEEGQYSYRNPGFSSRTGHFTQLVWKSSQKLGCGYVQCNTHGRSWDYLVCEYSPAGNIVNSGYFKANVLPAHRLQG